MADVDDLVSLGANAVIPEEFETSVEIFSRVLQEYHVPDHIVRQEEELIRSGTYRILRERSIPWEGDTLSQFEDFLRRKVIEVFYVSPGSPWDGRTAGDLPSGGDPGIMLLAILRGDEAIVRPGAGMTLSAGNKSSSSGARSTGGGAGRAVGMGR